MNYWILGLFGFSVILFLVMPYVEAKHVHGKVTINLYWKYVLTWLEILK